MCMGDMQELLLLSQPPSLSPDDVRSVAKMAPTSTGKKIVHLAINDSLVEAALQQAMAHILRGRVGLGT